MKSLNILRLLLQDAEINCSVETARDWVTIQSRFENEGLSFLTITLPSFAGWLEQSLELGMVVPSIFASFHRKGGRRGRSLPALLQGLTSLVFDSFTGLIRSDPDPSAVFFIRQICNFFKKVKMPCSKERNMMAIEKFLETDRLLPKRTTLDRVTQSVANLVISSLDYNGLVQTDPCLPKHGPGATFERLWGNQKLSNRDYYARWMGTIEIEELYGVQPMQDQYSTVREISTREEAPCRLSLVPKTLKAPRTIAVEPVAMQFAQQLVSLRLIAAMGKSAYTKHIKFDDQSVNNQHAKEGSYGKDRDTISDSRGQKMRVEGLLDGYSVSDTGFFPLRHSSPSGSDTPTPPNWGMGGRSRSRSLLRERPEATSQSRLVAGVATIDLSEASDRISASLVREIVRRDRTLSRQLFAVRSSRIRVGSLDGRGYVDKVLNKFSTSGSAVTFPVETLTFFILALSAIVKSTGPHRDLASAIRRHSTDVSVFGDDIVVPNTYCDSVCVHLEALGLKVNRGKTFSKGNFRESCGGDYFLGFNVTPIYLRHLIPNTRRESSAFASAVATSNQLFRVGCWHAAEGIRQMVDSIFKLPFVKDTSPGLGWTTFRDMNEFSHRRNAYGEYLVRTLVSRSRPEHNEIDGYDALLKALLSRGVQDDPDHLSKSVRQYNSALTVKMVTPY